MAIYQQNNQLPTNALDGGRTGGITIDNTPPPSQDPPQVDASSLTGNIKFLKKIYSNNEFKKKTQSDFSELSPTNEEVNLEAFFRQYESIFYFIPKEGVNSHSSLILKSTDYVRNFIDPKDTIINDLNQKIADLEAQLAEGERENLLYRNGTLIKGPDGNLHYMDKGYRRLVVWSGPEFHESLKVSLYGTVNPDIPQVGNDVFNNIPVGPQLTSTNFSEPFTPTELTEEISSIILEYDPQDLNFNPLNWNSIDQYRNALEKDKEEKQAVIDALSNKINSVNQQISSIQASDPDYVNNNTGNIGGSANGNNQSR